MQISNNRSSTHGSNTTLNVACIVALLLYGIDFDHEGQTYLLAALSPGGVKSKLAESSALASKNVSIVSASVSDTLKVKL